MYRPSEKTGGEKPIDLIRATRPLLIVDEPQSVEGGLNGKGKKAMERMNPLCNLRYSATPKEAHHMVFKLDAVDAYDRKLVKQIEVAAASVEGGHNKAYVRFIAPVSRGKSVVGAKVELDIATAHGVARQTVTVAPLDKLEEVTKRETYRDHIIGQDIRDAKDDEFMELRYPGGEEYLRPGQAYGDVDALAVQRQMVHRTIREHLDKEKRLRPRGIKVLSLFFIDAVEKYRQYDADGNSVKGEYARIFEEEYRRLAKHPDYQTLFKEVDLATIAEDVHNGYFSIDKKQIGTKTVEVFKDTKGTTQADDDTYGLIMRDKEKLLSFETPLKFIFSHSALREGWDNPNVFQICALREMGSEQQRRQTIGRGLRLCVNQNGERLRGFEINTLTVIATESYEQFAEKLQKEIEPRNRHSFRHRGDAPVRWSYCHGSRRPARAAGLRAVESAVGALENRWSRERARQGAGQAAATSEGRHADPDRAVRCRTPAGERDPPQTGRTPGDQERRRAQAGEDPSGRVAGRGLQGAVGAHQVQDHVPRAVRQRGSASRRVSRRSNPRTSPSPRLAYNGARPISPSGAPG